ncbi:MAG: MoaD/ThiS family protein [Deltaproteobacteria bacterium]|nr:MoaD/ThiS family protein [Deltaproteobacteria bacterium]
MKMSVKLFGTLREHFPNYRHQDGIEVEVPDGATANQLLFLLKISESSGAVVAMEGRILKRDDKMQHGAQAYVFQAIHGG